MILWEQNFSYLWEKDKSAYFIRWDKMKTDCNWNNYSRIWLDKVDFSLFY